MKKKLITLFAVVMLTVSASFANGIEVSKTVINSFNNGFSKATAVSWEKTDAYYKASFQLNGQSIVAFYAEDAELIAVSRNMLSTELPLNLQLSLVKNLNGSWITELFEYNAGGETTYFVTVENADSKTILQSTGTFGWAFYKKTDK